MNEEDFVVTGLVILFIFIAALAGGWTVQRSYDKQLTACARAYDVFECQFNAIPKKDQ